MSTLRALSPCQTRSWSSYPTISGTLLCPCPRNTHRNHALESGTLTASHPSNDKSQSQVAASGEDSIFSGTGSSLAGSRIQGFPKEHYHHISYSPGLGFRRLPHRHLHIHRRSYVPSRWFSWFCLWHDGILAQIGLEVNEKD